MKCPVCVESGQMSMVLASSATHPAPGMPEVDGMEYWDEEDKLHVHDSNCRMRHYQCTNGHKILALQYDACPSCGYNEGRTEVMAEVADNVVKYRFTKSKEWKKVVTFVGK